jgi:hypothetical protein
MMNNWSDDLRRDPPIWVQIPVPPYLFTPFVIDNALLKRE